MGATCCSQEQTKVETTAEPQEASPAKEDIPTLTMTFRADASPDSAKRVISFTKGPLGMSFNANSMPIVIKDVTAEGEASNLGVLKGMVMEKIDEEDITGSTYNDALMLMKSKVETLPKD